MTAAWGKAVGMGSVGTKDAPRLADDNEKALQALRDEWEYAYDLGTITVAEEDRPVLLWIAFRLEKRRPEPLIGFTAEALEAAIRDDWGEQP